MYSEDLPGVRKHPHLFKPTRIGKLTASNAVKYAACSVSNFNTREGRITEREMGRMRVVAGTGAGLCLGFGSTGRIRRSTVGGTSSALDSLSESAAFRVTQSTLNPGSSGTTTGTGDFVCLYTDLFTAGLPDTAVALDTDCDNSN